MKKIIVLLAALAMVAGCNTMEGLGKDIKKGGETIEKAAKDKHEKD